MRCPRTGVARPGLRAIPRPDLRAAVDRNYSRYEESQTRPVNAAHEDTWTEYSPYMPPADAGLRRRHAPPREESPLLAHRHSVWFLDRWERLALYARGTRFSAPFVVILSTSGVCFAEVEATAGNLCDGLGVG